MLAQVGLKLAQVGLKLASSWLKTVSSPILEASWSCRDLKKPIKTNGFFNIFGITSFVLKIASSWPKLASSWLKLASSWLQVDSSWPQVDSSWPYVASSWLKLASSWLKLGPSWLQVGSSWTQDQLREPPGTSPGGSWEGPGRVLRGTWSQEVLLEAPEVPKWPPGDSTINEKSIKLAQLQL